MPVAVCSCKLEELVCDDVVTTTVVCVEARVVFVEVVSWLVEVLTVKMVEAESPPGPALATTMYEPATTFATTNEAVNVPPEIEQLGVLTGFPESEQVVSLNEKPEPVTAMIDPAAAEIGLSTMDGWLAIDVVV